MFQAGVHHPDQLLSNLLTTEVHADAMGLHDGGFTIDIDNESWQVITLTMNQTIGVIIGVIGNADGLAHLQGRSQTRSPELSIDCYIAERQYTYSDRTLLVMANSDEIAMIGDHTHDFALADTFVGTLDGT